MPFKIIKPVRYIGPLPPVKMAEVRRSARSAAAASAAAEEAAKPKPISVEEIRGVTVTTWAPSSGKGVVVSEGVYTTYRYRDRLKAAGGKWVAAEQAWHLPLPLANGSDARAILAPPASAAAGRPSWVCCEKAKILSHKNEHYSCSEHTMYWEDCPMPDGQTIKILYSCSTKGGGCYTGT